MRVNLTLEIGGMSGIIRVFVKTREREPDQVFHTHVEKRRFVYAKEFKSTG